MRPIFVFCTVIAITILCLFFIMSVVTPSFVVKNIINKYSKDIFGIEISCDSADISLFSKNSKITNVQIRNPKNFSDDYVLFAKSIIFDIDGSTALSDVIVLNRLVFSDINVKYENYGGVLNRASNIDVLLEMLKDNDEANLNIKKKSRMARVKKKVIIKQLEIKNADININLILKNVIVAEKSFRINDLFLKDIGGNENGNSFVDVIGIVIGLINDNILKINSSNIVDKIFDKGFGVG